MEKMNTKRKRKERFKGTWEERKIRMKKKGIMKRVKNRGGRGIKKRGIEKRGKLG